MLTAIFLLVPLLASNQTIFAGDSGCQNGRLSYKYNNYGRQGIARQQEKFQAAQIRNADKQPPRSGNPAGGGGDSEMRSRFSYFASILFLFGGVWLLISLLRERWLKRYAPKSARLAKAWNLALKPSFTLSTFAFLFVAIIVGSVLTSPTIISAQKSEQSNDKKSETNLGLPMSQPVFKAAQQIGGSAGITQIGAPVFDSQGNRYVRGAFSGSLTIGETTLNATFGLDMFIVKYDAELNPVWVRQGSGLPAAPAEDLAVEGATAMSIFETAQDGGGYLYVAGSFVKTLTLQGGANPAVTLTDNGAAGYNYETFLAKYDLDGNLVWVRGGNSGSPKNSDNLETGQNAINKIVFDRNGNPYVAGLISGNNFLGAAVSSFVCSSNQNCSLHGKSDIIIAKLDKNSGAPTRVHVLGGADDDNGLDLAIDNVTNPSIPKLYLVGNFSSPQIYLPDAVSGQTYTNTANSINSFVLKFDSDDIQRTTIDGVWTKVLNNDGIIGVNQVATDLQTGQAYITGYYTGTISGLGGPFGSSITNNRTGTGEAALAGFVASLDTSDGTFVRLASLGGVGNAIAVRPQDGMIFVAGTFWDTGEFVSGGDRRNHESLGGTDTFVVGINRGNFEFNSVKAISGTGDQGLIAAGDPSAPDGRTKNNYSPVGISFNNNRVFVSGDFAGTLSLDCLTLTTPGAASRQSYIAEFLGYGETTTCRIWMNEDSSDRRWNEPANWNDGIIPADFDSVYVPYRRSSSFGPIYNPDTNTPLKDLIVAENQTVILQQNMEVSERLDLLGGSVDAGSSNKLFLGPFSEAYSINGGRVLGKVEKLLFGDNRSFTFPVGTVNGYSPVTISSYSAGKGALFAVTAHQGTYPNTADGLPANRAARWWTLTNSGLQSADLIFKYLPGDITTGTESGYRAYRIPTGGGTANLVASTINTTTKTVSVPNVTQFSDWTLAQLAPTAASVNVSGRVISSNGEGISNARVTMVDGTGETRIVLTNSFGYYAFEQVAAGNTYVFGVSHKRYIFSQPTQVLQVLEELNDINFTEIP